MNPKDFLCVLLVPTVLFVVVLLPVPIWTAMGRAMCLVITSLFVITIRVSVKQGGKRFLNLVQSLLGWIMKLLIFITKIKELSLSEDWVVDVVTTVIVVVVIVSLVSHQTRVSQGSDTNRWCGNLKKVHTILSRWNKN